MGVEGLTEERMRRGHAAEVRKRLHKTGDVTWHSCTVIRNRFMCTRVLPLGSGLAHMSPCYSCRCVHLQCVNAQSKLSVDSLQLFCAELTISVWACTTLHIILSFPCITGRDSPNFVEGVVWPHQPAANSNAQRPTCKPNIASVQ